MNLLLIGNKGFFSENIKNSLSKEFLIDFYEINKSSEYKEIISQIKDKLKDNFFNFLIYLGGETREIELMHKFNVKILVKIANLCVKKKISLIYLSSISVYGIPNKQLITTKSPRIPFSIYGKTKNKADILIKKKALKIDIFNLLPASIKFESKNNFYEKLKNKFKNPLIRNLFYFICPGGQFSFCTHEDISKEIIKAINYSGTKKNKNYYEKIISQGIKIKDIFHESNKYMPLYIIPNIKVSLLKKLFFFLSSKYLLRIIFLFTTINYSDKNDEF